MKNALLLLVSGLLFVACAEQLENPRTMNPAQPSVDETRSRELQRAQMDDVPVPARFELVDRENKSFSYEEGGVKVCDQHYWGQLDAESVASFYKNTMGAGPYGWTSKGDALDSGTRALTFAKERSTCLVEISTVKDGTRIVIKRRGSSAR